MSSFNLAVLFAVLVFLSGLFATIEIALFSVPRARARRWAQEKGPVGDVFRRLLDKPHALLVQVLLGNTLVGVGAAAVAAVLLDRGVVSLSLDVAEWIVISVQTLGLTVFFLIFCELTPKTVAFERNEAVAPWAARAYAALRPALAPFAFVLERLAGWSTRFVRGGEPEPLSADELETLVEVGAREGTLNAEESRLFRGAFRFGEKTAGEILIPRADVVVMDVESPIAAALDVFADARHARIPLYERTVDHIVGVLYAKDIVAWTLAPPGDRAVRDIMRPPFFARPATGLEELLRAFQKERVHLAVIVDEAGRALGIVTLEDVLEEIVGDLQDEFEEEEPAYRPLGDGRGIFRGRVAVGEVNRLLGVRLPGAPAETLAELVARLRSEAPAEGDSFPVGNALLTVEAVTGRQVWSVRVEGGGGVIVLSLVAVGILVSGFFSAVETALVSANRTRLSHRADAGDGAAARALVLLSDGQRLFGVTLVGSTVANIFVTTLATLWFEHRFGEWIVPWLVAALTAVLLVTGEIIPKAIARAQADDLAIRLAPPLDAMSRFLAPLIGAVNLAATGLVRLLGVRASPARAALNRQEFQLLLDESEETGQVAPGQGRILSRVMDFGEIVVGQAMRPRTEIVAVELGTSVREVIGVVRQKGYTRIPVYRDDLDQVVGIVHLFDLFRAPSPDLPVDGLLRPVDFVPEAKPCDELLREMRGRRRAIAIVVDEYGGTAGLVTLEDLVEELVGDIRGEEEAAAAAIRPLEGGRHAVDGSARIVDVNEALGLDLPEGDYETVAGLFLERFGRIPGAGDALQVGGVRFEVLAADARRIRTLAVGKAGK